MVAVGLREEACIVVCMAGVMRGMVVVSVVGDGGGECNGGWWW